MSMTATGLRIQAEAHGLDMADGNIAEFLQHTADFQACLYAEARFLQSQIDNLESDND